MISALEVLFWLVQKCCKGISVVISVTSEKHSHACLHMVITRGRLSLFMSTIACKKQASFPLFCFVYCVDAFHMLLIESVAHKQDTKSTASNTLCDEIQMKDSAAICSSMFSKKGEEINGEKLHKLGILSLKMQLGMSTSFWFKKSYALMYSTCSALWKEESVSCCCPVLQDYYFYFMPHIFRWPKAMSVTLKQ